MVCAGCVSRLPSALIGRIKLARVQASIVRGMRTLYRPTVLNSLPSAMTVAKRVRAALRKSVPFANFGLNYLTKRKLKVELESWA